MYRKNMEGGTLKILTLFLDVRIRYDEKNFTL